MDVYVLMFSTGSFATYDYDEHLVGVYATLQAAQADAVGADGPPGKWLQSEFDARYWLPRHGSYFIVRHPVKEDQDVH